MLDEQTVQVIDRQLNKLVDDRGCNKMLLNFQDVEYVSSAALGMLINLQKKLASSSGPLSLCNVTPQIFEVFAITKLDKAFTIGPCPHEHESDDEDPGDNLSGVPARLKPPKPSGGCRISLPPPSPENDG